MAEKQQGPGMGEKALTIAKNAAIGLAVVGGLAGSGVLLATGAVTGVGFNEFRNSIRRLRQEGNKAAKDNEKG